MKYKLIAFDMDGTLLTEKSSWWKIHRYFGTYEESQKNLIDYEEGRITYDEFMRRDIGLWMDQRPHLNTLRKVLTNYSFVPNAKKVIGILREREYELAIVTTALSILADAVASELMIDNVMANGVVLDSDGYLTTEVIFNVDLIEKEQAFNKWIENFGLSKEQCVAIGDSKYDIGFLRNAGLGIAFKNVAELSGVADVVITDLQELLNFL